jgi:hypothetical protein
MKTTVFTIIAIVSLAYAASAQTGNEFGTGAGNNTLTGNFNTGYGSVALYNDTSGTANTATGATGPQGPAGSILPLGAYVALPTNSVAPAGDTLLGTTEMKYQYEVSGNSKPVTKTATVTLNLYQQD